LIPELKIFLNHILDHEPLSVTSKKDCVGFINRLEVILKPPSLPPRSGRVSTTQTPVEATQPDENNEETGAPPLSPNTESHQNFIKDQREISWNGALWNGDEKPSLPPKPPANEITVKIDISEDKVL